MLAPYFEAGVGKTRAVHPAWVCFCLEGSAKEAGVSEAEAAVTGGPTERNAANQTSVLLTKQRVLVYWHCIVSFVDVCGFMAETWRARWNFAKSVALISHVHRGTWHSDVEGALLKKTFWRGSVVPAPPIVWQLTCVTASWRATVQKRCLIKPKASQK